MSKDLRVRARRDLDEDLRVFRSRRVRRSQWGWLRGVRQALGVEVAEVARKMKVGPSEVYRLENSEMQDTITLRKLRDGAAALGCELVYAVVPIEGTLEDLAKAAESGRLRRWRVKKPLGHGAKADPYGFVKMIRTVLTLAGWHNGPD